MSRRTRQVLLTGIAGVLLGLLAALLLVRARMGGSAQAPVSPPPPAAAPAAAAEATAPPESAETPAPTVTEAPPVPVDAQPDRNEAVEALFHRFAAEHTGRWNLCFLALPDGEPVIWGGEEGPMVSASLIKLPIMAAVFEGIARGDLDPAQCEAWLGPMITVSDNGSANALIRLLGNGDETAGMAAVNDWCRRQGLTDTRLNRLMLADNGLQNYTGAADCARLLAAIYRGDCVSPEASKQMLDLLLLQQVNDRLPAGLPAGTPVAHKTGDLIGLCWADVGVVFSPGGDYVLCVISDGQASEGEAKSAAAELSRQIYEIMNP